MFFYPQLERTGMYDLLLCLLLIFSHKAPTLQLTNHFYTCTICSDLVASSLGVCPFPTRECLLKQQILATPG